MGKHAIDQDLIRQLAALLKETELSEIEIEQDDLRIRVARTLVAAQIAAAPVLAPATENKSEQEKPVDPAKHPGTVPSPMVGTAYYSPAPGAQAVRRGRRDGQGRPDDDDHRSDEDDEPDPGTESGKVTEILVEDGAPVEYGEALVVIE